MGINSQPFIDDGNTVGMTMSTYSLLIKGVGRIAKTKYHKEYGGSIFQKSGNLFCYSFFRKHTNKSNASRSTHVAYASKDRKT